MANTECKSMRSARTFLGTIAAILAVAFLTLPLASPPAKAATYNFYTQTTDQVNGFDFNLNVTTDPSNVVTALSGTITGLGVNAPDTGIVTGFLPAPGNGLWNIDNTFVPTAPFFSASVCCSGIVADFTFVSDGTTKSAVNLYNDSTGIDWASFSPLPAGTWNPPGFQLNLTASHASETPLPAAVWLFGSVLAGGIGANGLRNKKKRSALQLAAA